MLPIWPDTDAIPNWIWLLAIVLFIAAILTLPPLFEGRDDGLLRVQQGVTMLILLSGALLAIVGGRAFWRLKLLREHGESAQATIDDLWSTVSRVKGDGTFGSNDRSIRNCFVAYRFSHAGQEYCIPKAAIFHGQWKDLKKGQSVRVYLYPKKPRIHRLDAIPVGAIHLTRGIQAFAGLALLFWAAGWLAPGVLWN